MPPSPRPSFDPDLPQRPKPGVMVVKSFPTPNLADRIFIVRKDARLSEFRTPPAPGTPYEGPDKSRYDGFIFATSQPADQTGWQDWFYINERANQDAYNYTIDFPYADREYPRYTRTYVSLRGKITEPQADDEDPVYNTAANLGLVLLLTDHKQVRFENDPILDALFVGVTRVYERLPGPVITSYHQNELKQVVTVATQAVETDTLPVSDALTESLIITREGTAKAVVAKGTVPDVFPATDLTKNWGSAFRDPLPLEFRSKVPLKTTAQVVAGQAVMPTLGVGDLTANQKQQTEFTKLTTVTHYDIIHVELDDSRLNSEGQVVTIHKILDPADQTVDVGPLVVSSKVDQFGDGSTIKNTETVTEVFPHLVAGVDKPDLIPQEFRGLVPTVTEAQDVIGTVQDPPVLLAGETKRVELQKTNFVKRYEITKRDLTSLPKSLLDKKLTEEYGGGILDILRTVDATVLVPDEGFDVVTSEVKNLGDGVMIRQTERVEGGIWPTLRGSTIITDGDTAGIKILDEKTVVPAGTANPGGFTDMRPIDKWRTIQFTQSVDLSTLPAPFSYYSYAHIDNIPHTLLEVAAHATETGGSTTDFENHHDSSKAIVTVSAGGSGKIGIVTKAGYRGVARAKITRTFFAGPPSLAQIPVPLLIIPSSGYATLFSKHVTYEKVRGHTFEQTLKYAQARDSSNGTAVRGEVVDFGNLLVGDYTVTNGTYQCAPSAGSVTSTSTAADSSTASFYLPGPILTMIVNIPPSTPSSLVSGQSFVHEVDVHEWRFNIWVMHVVEVFIP